MADYGFDAPSFSLGIDFDHVNEPPLYHCPDSSPQRDGTASETANLRIAEEEDSDFESYLGVSCPPQTFKRLRRGTAVQPSSESRDTDFLRPGDVDDEIEDFSSEEDLHLEGVPQSFSVCSSSKPSLRGHRAVISECRNKWELRKGKEASSASASTNIRRHNDNVEIPMATSSPLRKFQLIDSDSDGPYVIEDRSKNFPYMVLSPDEKQKNDDPWKEFFSGRSSHIRTPVFDEVCDEYFKNAKHQSSASVDLKESNTGMNRPTDSAPSVHSYFFHKDSRIQKLVRDRLPYFFPLGAANTEDHKQLNTTGIDYLAQFGHDDHSRKTAGETPSRMKKNNKRSRSKPVSQDSGNWVDPKSGAGVPKNAGNRRVQAASKSTGHWYTNSGGQRVYVSNNGQELTGRIAYKQYRKESGLGFKRSKKSRAAAAKRSASKKK